MFRWWSKKSKYENTRQSLRLPAAWPIKCEPQTAGDGRHVVSTRDISAGGVAVIVREMIPVGSRIRLEILVPPINRAIQAEGQVLRCLPDRRGGFELGIRFTTIAPEDQAALNEAIERFYNDRKKSRQQRGTWWRRFQ